MKALNRLVSSDVIGAGTADSSNSPWHDGIIRSHGGTHLIVIQDSSPNALDDAFIGDEQTCGKRFALPNARC